MAKYKVLKKCWRNGRLHERGDVVETDEKEVPSYFELIDAPKPKRKRKAKPAPKPEPVESPIGDDVL